MNARTPNVLDFSPFMIRIYVKSNSLLQWENYCHIIIILKNNPELVTGIWPGLSMYFPSDMYHRKKAAPAFSGTAPSLNPFR